MSDECLKRNNKKFVPFHNQIETERWAIHSKTDFSVDFKHISILYSGKIGYGITESIIEVASAIDLIHNPKLEIKLNIQTPTINKEILNLLCKFNCVIINSFVEYDQIPKIFSEADILLLANDFSPNGINYLRFSIPTKASEYMI